MKRLLELERKRSLFRGCFSAPAFRAVLALATLAAGKLQAQGTSIPPFVGDHSETWEEYPVQKFGSSAISIFGGIATVSGTLLETQKNGVFRNCGFYETPSDGSVLMGGDATHDLVTISFSQPVLAFGAHWDASGCVGGPDITFIFYDPHGNQVGTGVYTAGGVGSLDWCGYAFSTPIKTITYKGNYPVVDGMQLTLSSNLKVSSIAPSGANTIHLSCVGVPNVVNRIESSPDLSAGSFHTLASVMADANGAFQCDDPNSGTKRFYRVAYP